MWIQRKKGKKEEEDLYLDLEDKKNLERLPEMEREKILYERYVEKTRAAEREELTRRERGEDAKKEAERGSRGGRDKALPRNENAKSTYDIFRRIQLKRENLEKILYRKSINEVKGYFIKIRLPHEYAVYRITRVYEGERYEVDGIITNKWMSAERSTDKKEVNVQSVSNSEITEKEYEEYCRRNVVVGDREAIRMWKSFVRETEADPTDEELDYSLTQRRRFLKQGKSVTRRKIELRALISQAKDENDKEALERLQQELQEIEKGV